MNNFITLTSGDGQIILNINSIAYMKEYESSNKKYTFIYLLCSYAETGISKIPSIIVKESIVEIQHKIYQ